MALVCDSGQLKNIARASLVFDGLDSHTRQPGNSKIAIMTSQMIEAQQQTSLICDLICFSLFSLKKQKKSKDSSNSSLFLELVHPAMLLSHENGYKWFWNINQSLGQRSTQYANMNYPVSADYNEDIISFINGKNIFKIFFYILICSYSVKHPNPILKIILLNVVSLHIFLVIGMKSFSMVYRSWWIRLTKPLIDWIMKVKRMMYGWPNCSRRGLEKIWNQDLWNLTWKWITHHLSCGQLRNNAG